MNRLLLLVVVALITMVVLIFFTNPELLDKVWIWLIGFIGYVLLLLEKAWQIVKQAFEKREGGSHPVSTDADAGLQNRVRKLEEKVQHMAQQLKDSKNPQSFPSN